MSSLCLSDLAHPEEQIARAAFWLGVGTAIVRSVAPVVARVVHGRYTCPQLQRHGPYDLTPCDHCLDHLEEHILDQFTSLRRRLAADPATPMRELTRLAEHLDSAEARITSIEVVADALIRYGRRPHRAAAEAPQWLRSLYWQGAHRDPKQLHSDLCRRAAVLNGGASRPDRDLATAKWAKPLAADPAGRALLIRYVLGLRDRAADPSRLDDVAAEDGLSRAEAAARLSAALTLLRDINPDFYAANVLAPLARRAEHLDPCDDLHSSTPMWSVAPSDPAHRYATGPDETNRRRCRAVLRRMLARPTAGRQTGARTTRALLAELCDLALGRRTTALSTSWAYRFRVNDAKAWRLLRRLVRLVVGAGIGWLDDQLAAPPAT